MDYLRNDLSALSVAVLDPGPVGITSFCPGNVAELSADISSDQFNALNVPDRLVRFKSDPWKGFVAICQRLPHG